MLTEKNLTELAQQVLQRCGNDPAEVVLIEEDKSLTRFANNAIHQNVAERNITLHLRIHLGRQAGQASTNRTDPAALDALVEHAHANAAASPENPQYPGLAEPAEIRQISCFDQATAGYSPEQRADQAGIVCRMAGEKGLNASGAFSTGESQIAVANSQGVYAFHAWTEADFQTVVMAEDASGRAQDSAWRANDLEAESLGREAIAKAEGGRNPRAIEPGEFPVVFDPYVTEDLLHMLNLNGMGGQSVLEGRSWMNRRMGEQAMSPSVDIWDDGLDPEGLPLPFDSEGVPKHRVDLVSGGIVKRPVYDSTTAWKAGETNTGHALPPNLPAYMRGIGPIALNLFMSPGGTGLEEMIASTGRGLYITRFWYTRLVHPRDCVVTGMTRDGVFMIEKGEIAYPVKNLRFTQSYVQALAGVEAIGRETRLLKTDYGSRALRVPALKLSSFTFTGITA